MPWEVCHAIVPSKRCCDRTGLSPTFMSRNDPVPKVHLASPREKQPCPKRAACWSPATPVMGVPSGSPSTPRVTAKWPAEGQTRGRMASGTSSRRHNSGHQAHRVMSKSRVRDAFETSVMWLLPPVRRQIRKLSTVPKATVPASARRRRSGRFSSIQASLVPEK